MAHEADIFVVGGGPAGLAAAILARVKGFHVILADHARPPIDKACGEGLMPDTVTALATLGVQFAPGEARPFRGIRFLEHTSKTSLEAAFPAAPGLGVRRTILHAKLAQRAAELGVSLIWGGRVTADDSGNLCCDGQPIRARWIVGADGEGSRIRKFVAPGPARREQVRFGCRQHFAVRPWTDFVEVYWGRSCQIVATPIGAEQVGIAVTARSSHTRLANALRETPALAEHLAGARASNRASNRARGARCALRQLKAVQRGQFALIGDASGSVDPLTGEGLGLAFRQADALTDALRGNRLIDYEAAHRRIARVSLRMSRFLLWMDGRSWLRDRVLRAFSSEPDLFLRLLNTHIQAPTPSAFGVRNALRLGWRLVLNPAADV